MARAMRKVRTGSVVRTSMQKTAVVETVWKQRHRLYGKQMRRVARYRVHDPLDQCRLGDLVRIEETRPISKTKHWRVLEILQRRQVADVRPIELEADAEIPVDQSRDLQEGGEGESLETDTPGGEGGMAGEAEDSEDDDSGEEVSG